MHEYFHILLNRFNELGIRDFAFSQQSKYMEQEIQKVEKDSSFF